MTPGGGIPGEEPAQSPAGDPDGLARRAPTPAGTAQPPVPIPGILPAQQRPPGQLAAGHPASASQPGRDQAATRGTQAPAGSGKECPEFSDRPAAPDYTILKQAFTDSGPAADREIAYFYSLLFTANPELRALFPLAMDEQRRALCAALARCVWSMDNPQSLHEYLAELGRDHRKYGVREQHYQVFGETLASALRLLNGPAWITKPRRPGTRRSAASAP